MSVYSLLSHNTQRYLNLPICRQDSQAATNPWAESIASRLCMLTSQPESHASGEDAGFRW